MEFKNFIEDYNKLSKKEKNFLENNKSRYYSRIHNIIEKSGLFNKTIKYHNEFRSKEKLRINYHSVTKEFRSEPYFLEKFWITLDKYNYVPEYNSLGKQIGVKPDKLVLGIKIHFHWIELHTHIVEEGWLIKTKKEIEVYDYGSYHDCLTISNSWKDGIVTTIERETNSKSYLTDNEKKLFVEIENILNQTTIEILTEKEIVKKKIESEKKGELEKLNSKIDIFVKEFDKNNDGFIDFLQEEDDFMNLLQKHQKTIIEHDKNYITKFVQISNYLKIKKENIQLQFEKIKKSKDEKELNDFIGFFKNQIDTFNVLNYNSLLMIISIIENDLITFNEIYLTLDRLNIFNSNWEKEVSSKLLNIDLKLNDIIFSINKMELSIVNELMKMSIMNQIHLTRINKNIDGGNQIINESLKSLNSSLSSNLKSIGSSLNINNLISGINTYQTYKLRKG